MATVTRKDCSGCHDDFYNHTRCGANESSGAWVRYNRASFLALAVPAAISAWLPWQAALLAVGMALYAVLIRPAFGECYCAKCKAARGTR